MLRSEAGLSIMSILTLGLGIGLTTTVFSIVNTTLIEGLPFEDPHELVVVRARDSRSSNEMSPRFHDFIDWREQQRSFDGLAGFVRGAVNISGADGTVDRRRGAYLTSNAFELLGEAPILGRTFSRQEARRGGEPVAVIGNGLWQTRFGGREDVLGQSVRIDGEPHTVIGVMGPGFGFPEVEELWLPLRIEPLEGSRTQGSLTAFGRMNEGTDIATAQADLDLVARRLENQYPDTNEGIRTSVMRFNEWSLGDEARTLIVTMLVAASAVLLIACVNVANLLLARAAGRTRDMAVRIAVGASRAQVVAQLLTEAAALAVVGAILGLGIGHVGIRWFDDSVMAAETPPFWLDFRIDWNVMIFVSALAVGSGLLAGILPALQASGTNVNNVLKDEARGSSSLRMSRLSRALVSAEIALSFGLLVAASLMAHSILSVRNFDSNMEDDSVLVGSVTLVTDQYQELAPRETFWNGLLDSLARRPDVVSAALISNLPGLGAPGGFFEIEGEAYAVSQDYPTSRRSSVSPGFFDVVGVESSDGRTFLDRDTKDPTPAVVVNESFGRTFFPGESPVGRRIRAGAGNVGQP